MVLHKVNINDLTAVIHFYTVCVCVFSLNFLRMFIYLCSFIYLFIYLSIQFISLDRRVRGPCDGVWSVKKYSAKGHVAFIGSFIHR